MYLLQGAVATLSGSKLVCLNSAAGSPKLDLAMTLDIQATAEQCGFAAKMRNQAIEQLKSLETWVERQATGLDMAANPDSLRSSFDKLLKVATLLACNQLLGMSGCRLHCLSCSCMPWFTCLLLLSHRSGKVVCYAV